MATPSGLYTYPDLSVVYGNPELVPDRPDTLTNPAALVEVASDRTRDYDRGTKFAHYRSISSLGDYVIVDESSVLVEHYVLDRSLSKLDKILRFVSVPAAMPLVEIYRSVFS